MQRSFSIVIWFSGCSMFHSLLIDNGCEHGHYQSPLWMWQDFEKELDCAGINIKFCILRGSGTANCPWV